VEEIISEAGRGRHNRDAKFDLHCVCCSKNGHEEKTCRIPWEKIKEKQDKKEDKNKVSDLENGKVPELAHYIVAHCNIRVNEDLFNTSFVSWRLI
jgi:hypothetical protein